MSVKWGIFVKTFIMKKNHFIDLESAIGMTALYRSEKENILGENFKNRDILAISERFERQAIDRLLACEGCEGLRIYYGMSLDLKVHAILVAVDGSGNDLLPKEIISSIKTDDEEEPVIVEESFRCPPICRDGSPLNP